MSDSLLTHGRALAVAVVVTVLWSSSWILVRVGLEDEGVAPLTFAGMRYALAAVVLLSWISVQPNHRTQLRRLDRSALHSLVMLGVVFIAVTQGAQFVAIANQPAATTSLVLAPTALVVAALSGRAIGERSTLAQRAGAGFMLVGAWIYFSGDLGATRIGMLAALTALAANASGALLGRSINRTTTLSPVVVTAITMSVGSCLLLVAGLAVEGWPPMSLGLAVVIGWLGIVNTAIAFTLWNRTMQVLPAVESAAINNTMLVQIALLAWVFLGETPGLVGAIGIIVVTLGALVTTRRPSRSR